MIDDWQPNPGYFGLRPARSLRAWVADKLRAWARWLDGSPRGPSVTADQVADRLKKVYAPSKVDEMLNTPSAIERLLRSP